MQTRFKKNAKVFDLAILAVTLKDNAATPADITSTITGMTPQSCSGRFLLRQASLRAERDSCHCNNETKTMV